ncbi:3-hydroxy-9,10-secoandrosta-1,3,5(10)-triene-9,17-dione monooxygenase oxygenase subunit [Nocardioides sp. CCNWLW239]|uniref:3-hydroxy-9,10-secoandrosta-1,3,5(10)-triene-9, 17-dione monooxygenase oxygenase subunit n=1 Tax=Nocardioides sp. CCNWLW239 TaxID=3128902 RepID=UPI0030187A40
MSHEVLDAVRPLLPTIAARSGVADENRVLPAETLEELIAAGVLRMLQPKRYGGSETHPLEFYEVVRTLAGACGATGWVASVLGVHPWHVGLFPEAAQDDVYGADPDTVVCSAYAPVGRLEPVPGGYELSGRWSFSSGSDHAQWALLGALVAGADGGAEFVTTLVPRADFRVVDVWDVVGLRGTGSNDVVVDRAFVPAHRTLAHREQRELRGPGQAVNPGPLFRMPFAAVFTAAVTAPVVGAVSGCLDTYLSSMRERVRVSPAGGRFAEDPYAQVAVARASSEVEAAALLMDRNIAALYDLAVRGEEIPMALRLRSRRDQVLGTERALGAIDLLFKTAGGNSLHRGNPIERAWRDAHAGSVHVANDVERALAGYGRHAFGLPVDDTLV